MNWKHSTRLALLGALVMFTGCEQSGGGSAGDSAQLTCKIQSPEDGQRVSSPLVVRGELSGLQAEGEQGQLSLDSSDSGNLVSTEMSEDGEFVLEPVVLTGGTHELALEVTQGNRSCRALQVVVVRGPPDVTIVTPSFGQSFIEGAVIALTASVEDPDQALESLGLTWSSSVDGSLGAAAIGSSGLSEPLSAELSVGLHTLTATVVDQDGMRAEANLEITIFGPPEAPELVLVPENPTTGDDLQVYVVGGATMDVGYTYAWSRTGVEQVVGTESIVSSTLTSKGESWSVVVVAVAGGISGEPATASVEIGNSVPTVAAVHLSPVPTRVGDTITCSYSGYEDADEDFDQSVAWWFINEQSAGPGWTLSEGFRGGDEVQCDVIAFDGESSGEPVSAELVIANTLPSPPLATLSSLEPEAGAESLTCLVDSSGSDPDGDDLTVQILWWLNGSLLTDNGSALGVTTTTLPFDTVPALALIEGDQWTCSASAYDSEGASMSATVTAVVRAAEPSPDVVEDFSLVDTNDTSSRFGEGVSPRDYLGRVSAWYFGHAT